MNRYAQIARNQHRNQRPLEHALISDPDQFFEQVGEELQAAITARRDEILGPPKSGESPEEYRKRGYQALATAEELTLAEHHLFRSESPDATEPEGIDPMLERYRGDLTEINRAIHDSR